MPVEEKGSLTCWTILICYTVQCFLVMRTRRNICCFYLERLQQSYVFHCSNVMVPEPLTKDVKSTPPLPRPRPMKPIENPAGSSLPLRLKQISYHMTDEVSLFQSKNTRKTTLLSHNVTSFRAYRSFFFERPIHPFVSKLSGRT